MSKSSPIDQLGFFATPPHECSYLPDRSAVTLFADPRFPKNHDLYSTLSGYGFRRSGEHLYRPRCPGCQACVPVRVPVRRFRSRRSQRRVQAANADLVVRPREATFVWEHYDLFRRYIAVRHAGGGMDNPTTWSYMDFLTSSWAETWFVEFLLKDRLIAVAVMDRLNDALSAVYTFFDPEFSDRSPGTFAILWEIAEARRQSLDWLYLGYWIEESDKMRYKKDFRPLEQYRNGRWSELSLPRS